MESRLDNRTKHANAHAINTQATRNLPFIAAGHHRALQLMLATEANDMLLTPVQRRNARILQQHYHQQYIETCLHQDASSSCSSSALSPSTASTSSSSPSAAGKSLLDRVTANVDKALERKRTTRGFVSAIDPTPENISSYTLCLKDLTALSCEADLDLVPAPETLESLRQMYNQHRAEALAAAEADAQPVQTAPKAQEAELQKPKDDDVVMTYHTSSSDRSAQPIPHNSLPTATSKGKGSGVVSRNDNDRAAKPSKEKTNTGSIRNNIHTHPPPPASIPQPTRPDYTKYSVDEDEDGRSEPAVEYRSFGNHSNGVDRPSKRARADGTDRSGENGSNPAHFISAKEQLAIDERLQEEKRANHYLNRDGYVPPSSSLYSGGYGSTHCSTTMNGNGTNAQKTLGIPKRTKFKSPLNKNVNADTADNTGRNGQTKGATKPDEPVDERLRNIDPRMIEAINNEIMESLPVVTWDDISGLEHAKKTIKETITWPMLRPDIFTGLRRPPKGLLLFGPPGTGKTMIGKCIASQSKATFFSISSASLTSKWVGDGEKMVRALFAVARCHQPAVIFMDEIDSLLTQRSDGEVEASRRIKTEFLVQFDGVGVGGEEDRILIVGATNRPQEIDEAARRRFQKRLYIPLPEGQGRHSLMMRLLEKQLHNLTPEQIRDICERTAGYSGSDMTGLCREAALGPIRAIQGDILEVELDALRPINHDDFMEALMQVRASVSDKDLNMYREWDMSYGSMAKG